MQENNITSMREVFDQMTTDQLDDLLNSELESERPDGNTVRLILNILWEREKNMPVEVTPGVEKAWAKYKRNIARMDATEKRKLSFRSWFLRAASVAAVLCILLFALPREVGAESFFEKLARLTDSIVEFFSPGLENDNLTEYIFETDNPGLQQIYDTVVGMGVTTPVVPMWLPEGYELVEYKTDTTTAKVSLVANFSVGISEIMFRVSRYYVEVSHEYHWSGEDVHIYEHYGNKYSIMRNNDRWVVIWFSEGVECFLTLDCQEDTLYKILDSIYVTEDKTK